MGLMVYLGTPAEPVNRKLLRDADWGGMLLLGTSVSMIYAGLDQGNRLDWLESGTVMALLLGGGVLFVLLPDQRGAGSAALGARQRAVLAQCRALAGRHPALHAHQPVQFVAGAEFSRPCRPAAARTNRRRCCSTYGALPMFVLVPVSIFLLRHFDPRTVLVVGLVGFRRRQSAGTRSSATTGRAAISSPS